MKTKYLILVAALLCSTATWAQNKNKNRFENELGKATQGSVQQSPVADQKTGSDIEEFGKLEDILKGTNDVSEVSYNNEAKSLDFMYNGELYWYTIESNKGDFLELKLNRKGLKAYDDDNNPKYATVAVMDAMNEVNQDFFAMKMYYDRGKGSIRICQQSFVKTTAVITPNIVLRSVAEMEKAWKAYGKAYEKFSKDVQPEKAEKKNEQADNGKGVVFEDAPVTGLNVVKISLDVLDPNEEIVGDLVDRENISSDKVFYVRPVLTLRSNESATYNLQIKIKNENGDVLYKAGGNPNVTIEYGVDVKKKKEQNCVFPKFGSNKPGSWNKGVYKMEVYDGDIMLGRMQFTIE